MYPTDFVAFNVETATAKLYSLCQIGFVVVSNNEIVKQESYLVRPPDNEYSVRNTCLHGVDALKTKDKETFPGVWDRIRVLFISNLLVAHNANHELSVLRAALSYNNLNVPDLYCDCTYRLSGLSLSALCDSLEIRLEHHHNALDNAKACARAYLKLQQGIKPDHRLIRLNPAPDLVSRHETGSGLSRNWNSW